jgi:hypothetical protein
MNFDNLQAIRQKQLAEQSASIKHEENQLSMIQLQETVVKSFAALVDYLDSKVSRTEVVNQLREIGTPDAFEVVKAVNNLDATIKERKEVDLTDITSVLKDVLNEAKQIPKELPEQVEQKFVDYSEQLADIKQIVENVVEAIKAQKTTVEAPVVNVPETVVNVPETDLKPLEKGLKDVTKAIKDKETPVADVSGVETRLDKSNKLLKQIVEKPVGGGGGGSSWVAVNEAGVVQPLTIDNTGALQITGSITASASTLADFSINDSDNTTTALTEYFGFTKPDGTWLVKKSTATTMRYATVTNNGSVTTYSDAWAAIATLTYGRFEEAF